ncbi:unnamed protein product [Mytilus coruscus]|uniref:Uncharacterized protein n=1 Tax=Mytilus coruscus TaxID=42192 RepID=A0A6J8EDD6_MYTCO|nr:unnamed protein product [Mytilus coruscus]
MTTTNNESMPDRVAAVGDVKRIGPTALPPDSYSKFKVVEEVNSHNSTNVEIATVNSILTQLDMLTNGTTEFGIQELSNILLSVSEWKTSNIATIKLKSEVQDWYTNRKRHGIRISTVVFQETVGENLGESNNFGGAEVSSNVVAVSLEDLNKTSPSAIAVNETGAIIITLPTEIRRVKLMCKETILIHGNLSIALLIGQLVLVASNDAIENKGQYKGYGVFASSIGYNLAVRCPCSTSCDFSLLIRKKFLEKKKKLSSTHRTFADPDMTVIVKRSKRVEKHIFGCSVGDSECAKRSQVCLGFVKADCPSTML